VCTYSDHCAKVGNGGFSLRARKAMLDCCNNSTLRRDIVEDVALASCVLNMGGRIPNVTTASAFAVDQLRFSDRPPLAGWMMTYFCAYI
jgi:hypothetical protein